METSTPPPIETTTTTATRPTAITVICVIGFIGGLFTIPLIFTDIARNIGAWYPPYLCLQCCRRLRLYCRPLEDEAMGCLHVHRFRRPQSDCHVDDGCVERFRIVDSGHRHRHCFHTLVKDAMTMPPNHALQRTAASRSLEYCDIEFFVAKTI